MSGQYITYIETPIGFLCIEGNDKVVYAITFLDHKEWPSSKDMPEHMNLAVKELKLYFKGKLREFSFPTDQEGTEFRHRVWYMLTGIEYGYSISYAELARRLGDTNVIRAAGSANGKNTLAIVVPCHRVIGIDGKLVGYVGGLSRKQWLLDHEQKTAGTFRKLF